MKFLCYKNLELRTYMVSGTYMYLTVILIWQLRNFSAIAKLESPSILILKEHYGSIFANPWPICQT